MIQERKIALLIDAENIPHHRMEQVMAAVKNNQGGLVTVKRIYADWTKPNLSAWKAVLQKYAFLFSNIRLFPAKTHPILPW